MPKSSFFSDNGVSTTNTNAIENSVASAASSATAASTSATSAATSATSASANIVANQASAAASEAAKVTAVAAKVTAVASQAAALTSANNASTSAAASEASKVTSVAAQTSATASSASAATSATTATTKAASASISQAAAATSAANAQSVASSSLPLSGGNLTGNLGLPVNGKLILGSSTSNSLQIFNDGSNSIITESSAGSLLLRGTNLALQDASNNNYVQALSGGAVTLYDNSAGSPSPKIATTSSGASISGNIAVTGTVDGRDVATDGTKLDGIEASATADQTNAEIRTALEAASDSNVFTDADHTKLNGIAASANNYVLPSGYATETYVGTQITALVDSSPATLNTLNELAAALGDDPNFATTTANSIGTKLPLAGGSLSGNLDLPDNIKIRLGASQDLEISHESAGGGASIIKESGSGNLKIYGSNLELLSSTGEQYFNATQDGIVQIYCNNVARIKTSGTGASIVGNLLVSGTVDGRDVATDGTKLDGIEASATADQTGAQIKTAYQAETNAFTDAQFTKLGGIEALATVTNTASVTAAGALMDSELTSIASVKALNQGVATGNSPTFAALTSTGEIVANGGIALGDNDKATFGAGDDLQIYHDGSNSRIVDAGTGIMTIQASSQLGIYNADGTQVSAEFVNDGKVGLRFSGSEKLATTSTGIDVTGTATMDGLTVSSTTPVIDVLASVNEDASLRLRENGTGIVGAEFTYDGGDNYLYLKVGNNTNTKRLSVSRDTGDISFYEDTGSTPKFFWDASAESLGIGTSSLSAALDVHKIGAKINIRDLTSAATGVGGAISFQGFTSGTGSPNNFGKIRGTKASGNVGGVLTLSTSATNGTMVDRMTISESGNVGMVERLHTGTALADARITISNAGTENSNSSSYIRAVSNVLIYNSASAGHRFEQGGSEKMRINASGSILFGSTGQGYISGTVANTYNSGYNQDDDSWATWMNYYGYQNGATRYRDFIVGNGKTGRIATFDGSSGNVLVGKSTPNIGVVGQELRADGSNYFTSTNDTALGLNRLASDGTVLEIRRQSAIVGAIGAIGGDLAIFSTASGHEGLRFGNGAIVPTNNSGGATNNACNLGGATGRFSDLYLAGGVFLGGTGAANKLDDYEEGNFSLTVTTSGCTISSQSCRYTKVGRLVTLTGKVVFSALPTNISTVHFSGAPFTCWAEHSIGVVRETQSTGAIYVLQLNQNGTTFGMNSYSGVASNSARTIRVNESMNFSLTYTIA